MRSSWGFLFDCVSKTPPFSTALDEKHEELHVLQNRMNLKHPACSFVKNVVLFKRSKSKKKKNRSEIIILPATMNSLCLILYLCLLLDQNVFITMFISHLLVSFITVAWEILRTCVKAACFSSVHFKLHILEMSKNKGARTLNSWQRMICVLNIGNSILIFYPINFVFLMSLFHLLYLICWHCNCVLLPL